MTENEEMILELDDDEDRGFFDTFGYYFSRILLGVFVLTWIVFCAVGIDRTFRGPRVSDVGSAGQACYPNKTCNSVNTCFRIRQNFVCEKEIQPAIFAQNEHCFQVQDSGGKHRECFKTIHDCVLNLSTTMRETNVDVIKGCDP